MAELPSDHRYSQGRYKICSYFSSLWLFKQNKPNICPVKFHKYIRLDPSQMCHVCKKSYYLNVFKVQIERDCMLLLYLYSRFIFLLYYKKADDLKHQILTSKNQNFNKQKHGCFCSIEILLRTINC